MSIFIPFFHSLQLFLQFVILVLYLTNVIFIESRVISKFMKPFVHWFGETVPNSFIGRKKQNNL